MELHSSMFIDLAYIFVAAVAGGLLAWKLKLPLILGFVVGGIIISPFTPGIKVLDIQGFHEVAEIGVVLLMFSIGVEFSIPDLLRVKWVALLGGTLGIALSLGLAVLVAKMFGWPVMTGVVIGATTAVASTMVLARLLADRDAMSTTYGRIMIGITLFEDLAVVLMTVVLPSFGPQKEGHGQSPLVTAAWTLGKAIVILIPLGFFAIKVIPPMLRRVKLTNSPELFLLVALAVCLGTAAVAQAVGFSVALGAFLAGLAISASKDLHEAHDQLIPLRDAFVALFFVSLGTLIEPEVVRNNLALLGAMLLLIVPGKFIVWTIVVVVFRYSYKNAIAVAAGLTQIGELSFVVVQTATKAHLVKDEIFNATLAASLISIFINVFVVRAVFAWKAKHPSADEASGLSSDPILPAETAQARSPDTM